MCFLKMGGSCKVGFDRTCTVLHQFFATALGHNLGVGSSVGLGKLAQGTGMV